MAEPCCSQIEVATRGADCKANVRIEDDDVKHCTLSTKKQRARRIDVSLTVFISGIAVLEVLLVLVKMAVLVVLVKMAVPVVSVMIVLVVFGSVD